MTDGTFALGDRTAREFAQLSCPSRPSDLSEPKSVACAKVWGATESELLARLERSFRPVECRAAKMQLFRDEGPPKGTMWKWDYEMLVAAAKVNVPVTLP